MARIDHIGIAVRDINQAARLYVEGLGLALTDIETLPQQGVAVGFIPLGDSELELLEPLSDDTAVGRFLERRGEGLHHICIEVEDIQAAMAQLRELGARLLSQEPQKGARGHLVAFVHPRSANGVLLELSQRPPS